MATRYALTDGATYWKRQYDHDTGNMAELEKATTWATRTAAETKLNERHQYLCLTGRHNDAAKLKIVPVQA